MRASLLLPVLFLLSGAHAQTLVYPPRSTRVAILPIANVSGEKWRQLKDNMGSEVMKFARSQFIERGFKVLSEAESDGAVAEMRLDLTDAENFRKDHFYAVADRLHATLVLFAAIEESDQKEGRGGHQEGKCTMRVWLLDASAREPLLNAQRFTERSSPGVIFLNLHNERGSRRQVQAAVNCMRNALKDFLKPYPKVQRR